MVFERWRRQRWDGSTGPPRSSNAASSFHLQWREPPAATGSTGDWIAVEATLEVLAPPPVASLHFWALQASFVDRGRHGGAAHLGLQWYPAHPGSTAVNWGGYGAAGGELTGSASTLPSATGNVNTRDLAWEAGRAYRLRISPGSGPAPSGLTAWRGAIIDTVTGQETIVRELYAAGDRLASPLVWSEVFSRCDDAGVAVRWSGLHLESTQGAVVDVAQVGVNYQTVADGGCVTTDVQVDDVGVVQRTGTTRVTSQGAVLAVPVRP